jgi:hypothetical protein
MLPIRSNIYKRTMRFMSDPYVRMKKRAVFGAILGLIVLYLLMTRLFNYEPLEDHDDDDKDGGFSSKALRKQQHTSLAPKRITEDDDKKLIGKFPHIPPYEEGRDKKYKDINDGGGDAGAAGDKDDKNHHVDSHKKKPHSTHEPQKYRPPFLLRLILPLIAGFCFGFMGSVPIAGPTSAMVLRVGIQGEYETALTIAVGGAISEAVSCFICNK